MFQNQLLRFYQFLIFTDLYCFVLKITPRHTGGATQEKKNLGI